MEKFYTIAELEEILKLSDVTIRRYIKMGKLESQKIGRYYRIPESSVKAFLNAQGNHNEGGIIND
ncbi:MAG: helix-turn-helix domain-containing protein [Defluviitaleaceae bacterium]|nr:helix-turn-helix domain-containing protein [Defluviitaleaceae bacterium]